MCFPFEQFTGTKEDYRIFDDVGPEIVSPIFIYFVYQMMRYPTQAVFNSDNVSMESSHL